MRVLDGRLERFDGHGLLSSRVGMDLAGHALAFGAGFVDAVQGKTGDIITVSLPQDELEKCAQGRFSRTLRPVHAQHHRVCRVIFACVSNLTLA